MDYSFGPWRCWFPGVVGPVVPLPVASQASGAFSAVAVVFITLAGVLAIILGAGVGIRIVRGPRAPEWFSRMGMFRALGLAAIALAGVGFAVAGLIGEVEMVAGVLVPVVLYQLAAGSLAGFAFALSQRADDADVGGGARSSMLVHGILSFVVLLLPVIVSMIVAR